MGYSISSIAIGAGLFSAAFACFGAGVGFLQPFFVLEDVAPFYRWYFPKALVGDDVSLSTIARMVACLELTAGAFVIFTPSKDRALAHLILSCFFLYSVFGHTVVNDDLIPVATVMFLCSMAALMAISHQHDDEDREKSN